MSDFLALVHFKYPSDAGGAPAPGQASGSVHGFSMNSQEEGEWCWAAVTQAVERWRGAQPSQSEVASRHIDPAGAGLVCAHPLGAAGSGSLCAGCGADCGDPHSLTKVLDERGRLAAGGALASPPRFDEIRQSIDAQRPLPVRIEWGGGKGHFVCVTGYAIDSASVKWVTVHDPLLPGIDSGPADDQDLRYAKFASAYPSTNGTTGAPNYHYEVQ